MGLNHKVIFGLKLRQFRESAELSLTDLSARTGLSTSYLTEIEHGKKYPKAEKIERMATALGRTYDDLVSTQLGEALSPLAGFVASPILHNFPYHLFGIAPADVVELLTRQPTEASSLVKAIVGIAEQYNIGVEHLFRAALRAYQEINENYFPDIERAVDEFRQTANLSETPSATPTPGYRGLREVIESRFRYRLDDSRLAGHPKLSHFRAILLANRKTGPTLLINPALTELQRKFILAREIGYEVLGLKERAMTSAPERVDSFEQVLNDFKASYFAGALLVNRERVVGDFREFFALDRWHPDRFREFLSRYEVTPEVFMYRLTEVLPQFFGVRLHFLRFNHEGSAYRLVKHLNMSEVLIPGGTGVNEHYCRRWLAIRILARLEHAGGGSEEPIADAQLSRFVDSGARFLCIAFARHLTLNRNATSSVSLGLRFDEDLEGLIKFAHDPAITNLEIDGTCERCRLMDCQDRAVGPVLLEQESARQEIERDLASLG